MVGEESVRRELHFQCAIIKRNSFILPECVNDWQTTSSDLGRLSASSFHIRRRPPLCPALRREHDTSSHHIMTGNINTAADGYSRTDQHIPIATSAQPPAPPLESEYNDGRFDGNGAGGDASDTASQTSLGRHLPHPDRPTLEKTHEGEHRYDHGDLITDMNITRGKRFALEITCIVVCCKFVLTILIVPFRQLPSCMPFVQR